MQNIQVGLQDQETPIISFIITDYNIPVGMLLECVDSIIKLSLKPSEREIIIVDDGSDVSPINDLLKYGDGIIYIRENNSGVSTARNTGIRIARGIYIQFIDGDDTLLQTPYEHCLDIMRYRLPDIVMFDHTHIQSNSTPFEYIGPTSGTEYMHNNNIHGSACGYIFRKDILGTLRFSPNIAYSEDEEFTAQLLLRCEKLYATESKAYYYRERKSSAIHNQKKRSIVKRINDIESILYRLNDLSETLPFNDRIALKRRIAQLTMDYIYNTIVLTHSRHHLDKIINKLHKRGLFPLPDQNYSKKYRLFRKMTNSNTGLNILLRTIPWIDKNR